MNLKIRGGYDDCCDKRLFIHPPLGYVNPRNEDLFYLWIIKNEE